MELENKDDNSSSGGNKIGNARASYTITSSTTLYAQWEEVPSYSIIYNLNGGNGGASAPTTALIDSNVTISRPTINKTLNITFNKNSNTTASISATSASGSYTFSGWTSSSAAGLNTSTAKTSSYSATNITTAWNGSSTTNQYFKNLASDKGTVTMTANWSVSVKLATVTRTMYTCTWNTASDGSGTQYASGATYTSTSGETTLTLYAVCTYGSGGGTWPWS